MRRAVTAVSAVLALAGCSGLPHGGEPAQATAPAAAQVDATVAALAKDRGNSGANAQVLDLLAYFSRVARLPAAEQRSELVQAAQAFGREGTPYARVRLGGLHALPVAGLRDDARALTLLEPLAKAPTGGDAAQGERAAADLAFFLYGQVAERQRLQREERDERQRMLREETRKQDALRERLEALKAIERSIMQREERSQSVTR